MRGRESQQKAWQPERVLMAVVCWAYGGEAMMIRQVLQHPQSQGLLDPLPRRHCFMLSV
jgi:hypothetical protein